MNVETKAAVTVAEMARMCGLSRARFYQLIGSAFPWPLYDVSTRRPFYGEEAQKVCLEVRRRNCGIDGKAILFYARGPAPKRPPITKKSSRNNCSQLVDGLRSLGLVVSPAQAETALKELGLQETESSETLRAVFVHLKQKSAKLRQNSNDNVDR